MILTAGQLARFYRCGELYRMADVDRIPYPPGTSQIVSRVVRQAIQDDMRTKQVTGAIMATPEARANLEGITRTHLTGETFLTEQQASTGNRRIYETVLLSAQRCYLMWRAVVSNRLTPVSLNREFSLSVGAHEITGIVEMEDPNGIRATKVRTRRPEEGEASRDLSLAIQAMALSASHVIVDYLIEAKELLYVRQEFEVTPEASQAALDRVRAALEAIDLGCFVPAPAEAWWCRSCQLRPCCRYVP